ncbi:MAG: nucleotide exchange factor GrpE [Candidatus Bathyarchaeia archaeon]|jgi:molecular chaperone GrpE
MCSEPLKPKPKRKDERIAELEDQLAEARMHAEAYLNQLKYTKADLDNIQKQSQRRIEESIDRNNARIFVQLTTLADELLLIAKNTGDEGVKMIYTKLLRLLESEGVTLIDAVGKPFDPYRHEAILEAETDACPPGTVVEEIRKGYNYKDKVLCAAIVKVARAPSKKEEKDDDRKA